MKTLSVLLSKTLLCTPPPLQSDHPLFKLCCYLFSHLSPISSQIRFHGLWQYKLTHHSDLQIRRSGVRTETLRGALDSNSDLRQSSKELDEEWGCSMSLRQKVKRPAKQKTWSGPPSSLELSCRHSWHDTCMSYRLWKLQRHLFPQLTVLL